MHHIKTFLCFRKTTDGVTSDGVAVPVPVPGPDVTNADDAIRDTDIAAQETIRTDTTAPGEGEEVTEVTEGSGDELKEWDSDSSFEFDNDDLPLTGMTEFVLAKYEGDSFPFQITESSDRVMYGFFFQPVTDGWVREDAQMLVKKKNWVKNIKIKDKVSRGTKRRMYYVYHFEL